MSEAEAATSAGVPQNDDALPPSTSAEEVQQSNSGDVKNDNNNDDNGDDDTEQSKPLTTLGKKSSKKKSKPDTEVLYSTGATAKIADGAMLWIYPNCIPARFRFGSSSPDPRIPHWISTVGVVCRSMRHADDKHRRG